jgi:hypothetical protein
MDVVSAEATYRLQRGEALENMNPKFIITVVVVIIDL